MIVCTANLMEIILMSVLPVALPSMMPITCVVQIITGMNIVAIEQDLVHGSIQQRVSRAPSTMKNSSSQSSPGKRSGAGGGSGGYDANGGGDSPSMITSSNNWQTNSKDVNTFQTDSSFGSPILHSMWNKHSRKHSHRQQQGSRTMTTATPGITFEQKKMHFYDDIMTDVEKEAYNSPMENEQRSNNVDTFIIANSDNDGKVGQEVSVSISTPTRPLKIATNLSSPHFSSPSPSMKRDNSCNSSRANLRGNYNGSIHSMNNSSSPFDFNNVTPTKKQTDGVSIRSIRANMDSAGCTDQTDAASPLKHRTVVTNKSLSNSPTFEIRAGTEGPARLGHVASKTSDTCSINMKSPYPFASSHQTSPSPPHQLDIHHQTSLDDLSSNNHDSRASPVNSRKEYPGVPEKRNKVYSDSTKTINIHSRQRSNHKNTVLEMSQEDDAFEDELDQSIVSGDDTNASSFGHKQAHKLQRGIGSLELGNDPFRP